MKNIFFIITAVATMMFASCGSNATEAGAADSALSATEGSASYVVDSTSVLNWGGSKIVGVGAHKGTIAITEGSVSIENGNITAGTFTIDMTKMTCTDSIPAEYSEKLIGHLGADDFFSVAKFPTAKSRALVTLFNVKILVGVNVCEITSRLFDNINTNI